MQNMKLGLVFGVLCVLLAIETSWGKDSTVSIQKNDDSVIAINKSADVAKPIVNVVEPKTESSAKDSHENGDPKAVGESDDVAFAVQQEDGNKASQVGDNLAAPDTAMIQKQIELMKQPGMRRLARALNRFHEGQLFESPKRKMPIWAEDDDDDAIAEERAVRRRTRIRRRNSSNKVQRNRRKNVVRNKNSRSTRRKQSSKNSQKRKNRKVVKNRKISSSKKGAKNVKKTRRNKKVQRQSKRKISNRVRNNRRNNNNKYTDDADDSDNDAYLEE